MSAALAAAIVRNRPAIGSRVAYTVRGGGPRVKGKNADVTKTMTVTAHEDDRVVLYLKDYGTIRMDWPERWQDGTCKEAP